MALTVLDVDLVIPATGQRFAVSGRTAAILAVLAEHADEINAVEVGKVTVDCTPTKAHVDLSRALRPVRLATVDLNPKPRWVAPPAWGKEER